MARLIDFLTRRPTPAGVTATQLYEAQRYRLEHLAAAEHHQALANMYAARVKRLQKEQK